MSCLTRARCHSSSGDLQFRGQQNDPTATAVCEHRPTRFTKAVVLTLLRIKTRTPPPRRSFLYTFLSEIFRCYRFRYLAMILCHLSIPKEIQTSTIHNIEIKVVCCLPRRSEMSSLSVYLFDVISTSIILVVFFSYFKLIENKIQVTAT